MIRKCAFAFIVSSLVLSPMWFKAIGQTNPLGAVQGSMGLPCGGIGVACNPVVNSTGPLTAVVPTPTSTSKVFSIGQAFGWAEPYIDSLTSSLIASLVAAAALYIRRKWNINIDEGQRTALVTYLQDQAASLIADGFVRMENKKLIVDPVGLDAAANHASNVIPDALKHFDIDGPKGVQVIKEKIIDQIPQTTAGAAIVAQAHQVPTPVAA